MRNSYESITQKETEPIGMHKNAWEARNDLSIKRAYMRPDAETTETVSIESRSEMRREEITRAWLKNRY